jgi:nicotinamidase-related amidase
MKDNALLLIDLQYDYFPGGTMELVGSDPAVQQAARLLQAFRQKGLPIFHVQHISKRPGATFFLPGTKGAEIHEAVKPAAGESVTVKHFPNSFRETGLQEALRAAGITKLVVAGMMTHMCVDTSVRAAADMGFACSLASDAVATKELAFNGTKIDAQSVQLSYLAGLNGAFAAVQPAQKLIEGL